MKSTTIKLVMVGPSSAGKTSLAKQFCTGNFDIQQEMTVGSAFFSKAVQSKKHNTNVRVEIWDTAGQERYRAITPLYFRNASGAVLAFDISDLESFESARDMWLNEVLPHMKNSTQFIVLAANKCDIIADSPRSYENDIATFADAKKLRMVRTSAKTTEGVADLFETLVDDILDHKKLQAERDASAPPPPLVDAEEKKPVDFRSREKKEEVAKKCEC